MTTGQTISHYEILEKLGEGGMGVVYRARDTKLDRDVALKFLPAHLAASEQDKARFVQEAKAAAALNHPNVCSIIDIQEHETEGAAPGTPGSIRQMFIVMEFVDGMTLRQKMEAVAGASQPYPVKQAIDFGIQVADGLAAAHEKGIVHRDVKPENIMVRKDGIAQVMDFGLAKLRGTVSRITKAGSTVGTAGYMSPEQVQGLDADHRSDIFSLGAMLYELFTGRLPFKGVHETALMYEIVNVEPEPMSTVNPALDPELDRIVYECLQKDPEERYQSVKEVSRDLKRVRRESSRARMSKTFAVQPGVRQSGSSGRISRASMPAGGAGQPSSGYDALPVESKKPSRAWVAWLAVVVVAALGAVGTFWRPWAPAAHPSGPVTRLTIRFPEEVLIPIGSTGIGISPDGKYISLAVQSGLETKLFLRPSDREVLEPVLGSGIPAGQVYYHTFSPDGQWLAFNPGNTVKKVSVFGGAPVSICDIDGQPRGMWWGTDRNIYFGHISSGIFKVSEDGGSPEPVTVLDSAAGELSHRFPALLPDGKSLLFTIKFNNITTFEEAAIGVLDTKSGVKKTLIRGGSYARYVPTGHLVYIKGNFVYAVPFDLARLEVTGPPKKLFKGGWMNPFSGDASIAFTADGTLLYIPRGSESYSVSRIKWIDFKGNVTPLVDTVNSYWTAQLSPDGEKLALHVQAANDDIWIYHLGRKSLTRLTFGGGNSGFPVWSADGKYVIYAAERGMRNDIYRKTWDGSGGEERLTNTGKSPYTRSITPDGKKLAFAQDGDIWTLDLDGGGKSSAFMETASTEFNPVFSPDGRYIAYESNESGRYEVFITSYPSKSGKWQVSSGGGTNPNWDPSGKILYFAQGTSIYAVDIRPGASFDFSAPRKVLDMPPEGSAITGLSPDGKRFAMITIPYKELNTSEVTMVTN
jgi:serine/threonine protein kinase/Tol biopolymer transport system component